MGYTSAENNGEGSTMTGGQEILPNKRQALIEAVIALLSFCVISLVSRVIPVVFLLVVGGGLLFPIVWGVFTKSWGVMGFTRRHVGRALIWGAGSGIMLMVVIWFTTDHKLAPFFFLQLIVGIPAWILIMSPFQEFFFRGWLQPRFVEALGPWLGIAVTSVAFALWHLLPPFEEAQIVPILSIYGMTFTAAMGLIFGYIFHRTGNIVAPWLAHVLAGLTLVLSGAMTFVQYVE
jgi:membrane protease YdiL (CAAX protease family)